MELEVRTPAHRSQAGFVLPPLAVNLLLMFGTLFFTFLLCEIATRMAMSAADSNAAANFAAAAPGTKQMSEPVKVSDPRLREIVQKSTDSDRVYELRPHLTGTFLRKEFSTNSFGMRDREVSLAKSPGVVRVAAVGDSILFGWGVNQNETYLRVAEEKLNSAADGPKFEFLNFGVPGYNTAIEVATVEKKVLGFDPDILVVHFVNNDFEVPAFLEVPKQYWSVRQSFLFDAAKRYVQRMRSAAQSREIDLVGFDMAHLQPKERGEVLQAYRYMVGKPGFAAAMEKLAGITKARGIPVIIVFGKTLSGQGKFLYRTAHQHNFVLAPVRPAVDAYFASLGTGKSPAERRSLLAVAPNDGHPNALGHRLYAEALLEAIRKVRP